MCSSEAAQMQRDARGESTIETSSCLIKLEN